LFPASNLLLVAALAVTQASSGLAADKRIEGKGARLAREAVEKGYSTAIVRANLDGREYRIPMNYLTPFGNQQPEQTPKYLNVFVFMPDYRGYDRENYKDPFDRRKITLFWGRGFGGLPAEQKLANAKVALGVSAEPREQRYGLAVHSSADPQTDFYVGRRKTGELLLIRCRYAGGAVVNPSCDARYPTRDGHGIAYRFSLDHLQKWREIDERLNALIAGWRAGES
jgi:hypothetical protein